MTSRNTPDEHLDLYVNKIDQLSSTFWELCAKSSLVIPGGERLLLFETGCRAQLLGDAFGVASFFVIVEHVGLNFAYEVVKGTTGVVEIHLHQELAAALVHFAPLAWLVQPQLLDNVVGPMLRKLQVELGIWDVVFLELLLDLFLFVVGLEHLVDVQIAMLLEHPVGRLVLSPRFQQRLFASPVLQLVAEIRAQLGPRSFASPVVRIVRVD